MAREATEVAGGVFVTTSTRYLTTSTIVVRGSNTLLVDPAWTVPELSSLLEWLSSHHLRVTSGFSTHAHHDHLLWHPGFGDAPRWASAETVELAASTWHDELREQLDDEYRQSFPDSFRSVRAVDGDLIPEPFGDPADEPAQLLVHDGHAPGHAALWLPERGAFVAGDLLSDVELPLPFAPDDLGAYLAALDTLAPFVALAEVLIPGHGHPTQQPMERLDADRRYLDAVLRGADPDDPRRGNPGMDDAHRRVVELARTLRSEA